MGVARHEFDKVLRRHVARNAVDRDSSVLILGGSDDDVASLGQLGFRDITLSNLEGGIRDSDTALGVKVIAADAEDLDLPDGSYDVIFVHAVLHHCRSPHRALCEMLRVARHHVVMLEPNDSASMRLLVRLGLSFPYEIAAVVSNEYRLGGVRNTNVPNFIYRWDENEVTKTASSFLAEYEIAVDAEPYWSFEVDERELAGRTSTRIPKLMKAVGPRRLLSILSGTQSLLNVPPMRGQGNKFFCWISKTPRLKPWLARSENGGVKFNRQYGA
jgi:SAM-dependent methyltransferase